MKSFQFMLIFHASKLYDCVLVIIMRTRLHRHTTDTCTLYYTAIQLVNCNALVSLLNYHLSKCDEEHLFISVGCE